MKVIPFADLPVEEREAILSRRLQRAQTALAEAERALEGRMRELDTANRQLRKREVELVDRLDQESRQLLAAQRTARFATVYGRPGLPFRSSHQLNDLFGLPFAKVPTPQDILARVHPLDVQRISKAAEDFFAGADTGTDNIYLHRVIHPERGLRWLKWSIRREDRDGVLNAVYGSVHDITETRANERAVRTLQLKAERRVRELDRLAQDLARERERAETALEVRTRVLTHFAHQFRTPLSSLAGAIDLLGEVSMDDKTREALGFAEHAAERLTALVEEALAQASGESEDVTLFPAPADPAALLRAGVRFWRAVLEDTQEAGRLVLSIEGSLPDRVDLDAVRVRELVDCLIGYGLEIGSRVCLVASWSGRLVLRFQCEGIAVFDSPSTAQDQPQWRRAHFLAGAMGGTIQQVEHAPFATSDIILPFPVSPYRATENAALTARSGGLPRILLAEDTLSNQQIIAAQLERMGCIVVTVNNGLEALTALETGYFDAVLMDVQMPVMDGEAASRHIRSLEGPVSRVPIVGITAHSLHEERERLLAAGMSACLTKPVKHAELRSALKTALFVNISSEKPDPVFDTARFVAGFEALPEHFRERFLEAVEADLDTYGRALGNAVLSGDLQAIDRQAHALKGVAATIGAQKLVDALAGIRSCAPHDIAIQFEVVSEQLAATRAGCRELFAAAVAPQ